MTNIFVVVGEHRDNPVRLLLLGADGRYYEEALPSGRVTPADLGDAWIVDAEAPQVEEIAA
jgi:hypothetical protein